MAQEKKLNLTAVARGIENGIETADAERAKALEHLQLARNTKAKSLTREHDRLADKYGDKHPRVLALAARIKLNEGLLSNLSAEVVRAKTAIPKVDETSWVLHGFVRDLNGNPLSQLTIAPYDRADKSGVWVKELGYASEKRKGSRSGCAKSRAGPPSTFQGLRPECSRHCSEDPYNPEQDVGQTQ